MSNDLRLGALDLLMNCKSCELVLTTRWRYLHLKNDVGRVANF